MVHIIFCPTNALPFINQAKLIEKLALELGHTVEYVGAVNVDHIKEPRNASFLWVTVGCKEGMGGALWPNVYADQNFPEKRRVVYATIEGVPTGIAHNPNYSRMPIVAVSKFAYEKMREGGLNVTDVCHHAIDVEACKKIVGRRRLKGKLDREYKDRVKFLLVARDDPRKGIGKVKEAMGMVNERCKKDFVLLMITPRSALERLGHDNAELLAEYGSLTYNKVLELMAAVDYGLFPSVLEGFGLPLLEFNAVGIPVLHNWMPPLDEFSSEEFNFVWDYSDIVPASCLFSQRWEFFDYYPEDLAEAWVSAIEIFKGSKSEYEEYRAKAMEHAHKWDYRKVYTKLIDRLTKVPVTAATRLAEIPRFLEEARLAW